MEENNFTSQNKQDFKNKKEVSEFDFVGKMSEEEQLELRNRMLAGIKTSIQTNEMKSKRKQKLLFYSKVAATLLILFALNFIIWMNLKAEYKTFQTGVNETKEVVLPDGSKVIMNSNSRLSYSESSVFGFDRKVELEGEAYFEITKTEDSKRFIVNEKEMLEVEVFGTEFNFKNQHPIHKLTLIEGSVKLGFQTDSGKSNRMVIPGETVKLNPTNHEINVKVTNAPGRLVTWKERKIKLNDESLVEVLSLVSELYDLEYNNILENDEKLVSGSLPLTDNANEVIKNISILFNKKIDLENRIIRVQ